MSYILDALKKSEQARGGRKTRKMDQEPAREPGLDPKSSGPSRRMLYLIAFILSLNAAVLVLWIGPRRKSAPPPRPNPAAEKPGAAGLDISNRQSNHPALLAALRQPGRRSNRPEAKGPEQPGRPSTSPAPLIVAQGPKPGAAGLDISNHPAPLVALKSPQPEAEGHGQPGRRPSRPPEPSNRDRSPQNAVGRKSADLQALLEKQAERVEKSARPAPSRKDLADIRVPNGPETSNEPARGVPRLNQLPPQIRETLPDISVSMLVYSKQPAARFIYINGSKRHEGDEISSGLKLVGITHEGAIFTYLGHRFYKSVLGD